MLAIFALEEDELLTGSTVEVEVYDWVIVFAVWRWEFVDDGGTVATDAASPGVDVAAVADVAAVPAVAASDDDNNEDEEEAGEDDDDDERAFSFQVIVLG